jgi:DNA-binding NarL/FixJ family response regulator
MMLNKIKIFVADDHQLILLGLKAILKQKSNYEIVGFAKNGLNLINQVIESNANILIMDISMPEKSGLEVIMDIHKIDVPFKTIILSSHEELEIVRECMKFGAKGYVTKSAAFELILEAIETVLKGDIYYCINIQRKMNEFFSEIKPFYEKAVDNSPLTFREIQVLKLIAKGFTGKKISETLNISTHTVDSHRKKIFMKLQINSSIELVKYALNNNLVEL